MHCYTSKANNAATHPQFPRPACTTLTHRLEISISKISPSTKRLVHRHLDYSGSTKRAKLAFSRSSRGATNCSPALLLSLSFVIAPGFRGKLGIPASVYLASSWRRASSPYPSLRFFALSCAPALHCFPSLTSRLCVLFGVAPSLWLRIWLGIYCFRVFTLHWNYIRGVSIYGGCEKCGGRFVSRIFRPLLRSFANEIFYPFIEIWVLVQSWR